MSVAGRSVAPRVALIALRGGPSRAAERVSEALCGEPLAVLEETTRGEDRWLRARGADGYVGWIHAGAVAEVPGGWPGPDPVRVGAREAVLRSAGGEAVRRVVAGGILRRVGRRRDGLAVALPGGEELEADADIENPYHGTPGGAPLHTALACRARALAGIPYRWGGRSLQGFDCSGLTQWVFAELGVALPRDAWEQEAVAAREGSAVAEPGGGDLLFWGRGERAVHVGIGLGAGRFLHAREWVRVGTLTGGPDADLADRTRGVYRFGALDAAGR